MSEQAASTLTNKTNRTNRIKEFYKIDRATLIEIRRILDEGSDTLSREEERCDIMELMCDVLDMLPIPEKEVGNG